MEYFKYKYVTGRETLVDNVLSLLKNECIDAFQIGEITNSGKLEYHGLTA